MKLYLTHDDRELGEWEEGEFKYSLYDILLNRQLVCASCGKEQDSENLSVGLYDHSGGELLVADQPKQWVSIECSCGYHTSLNKLKKRS